MLLAWLADGTGALPATRNFDDVNSAKDLIKRDLANTPVRSLRSLQPPAASTSLCFLSCQN